MIRYIVPIGLVLMFGVFIYVLKMVGHLTDED